MAAAKVQPIPIPQASLARVALPRTDYADAYAVAVPDQGALTIDEYVYRFFERMPGWVQTLMRMRNRIVRLCGLKTTPVGQLEHLRQLPVVAGTSIGLFKIWHRSEEEVVMGHDDRHLDFRVSLLLSNSRLSCSTVVQFHNVWGRAYFLPVKPFHRFVVPAALKRMV